jgi:hypothetical protein
MLKREESFYSVTFMLGDFNATASPKFGESTCGAALSNNNQNDDGPAPPFYGISVSCENKNAFIYIMVNLLTRINNVGNSRKESACT